MHILRRRNPPVWIAPSNIIGMHITKIVVQIQYGFLLKNIIQSILCIQVDIKVRLVGNLLIMVRAWIALIVKFLLVKVVKLGKVKHGIPPVIPYVYYLCFKTSCLGHTEIDKSCDIQ